MDSDQVAGPERITERAPCPSHLLQPKSQGQVVLRCSHINNWLDLLCIHPGTHLIDKGSGNKSWLVHTEGIPVHPEHLQIETDTHRFLLVFQPLPAGCREFDFIEPCQGGYAALNIPRNRMDVYDLVPRCP